MSDFHHSRKIKSTRRDHTCEQCQKTIEAGSPSVYGSGLYEGDFYSMHIHVECQAAAKAYADLHGCYGEEWPWFSQYHEKEDEQWMRDEHPIVADRLGWKLGEPSRPREKQGDFLLAPPPASP